jgi:hypothetical protein
MPVDAAEVVPLFIGSILKLRILAGGEKGFAMELVGVPAVDGRERFPGLERED